MKPRDPVTPAEWRDAVNAAAFWLLVDSARLYGLVTAPAIDTERCESILKEGLKRGVRPDRSDLS